MTKRVPPVILYSAICFIIAVSVFPKLTHLNQQTIDAHSWRQSTTYAIAKNFLSDNNILNPRSDEIRPDTNFNRLYLAEFPNYEYILSIFFRMFGQHIAVAKIFSIILFTITALSIYYIGFRLYNFGIGFFSAVIFSLFPSTIYWGQSISPEIFSVAFSTISLALLLTDKFSVISSLIFALSAATKMYFMILVIPIIFWLRFHRKYTVYQLLFYILPAILLNVLWLLRRFQVPPPLRYPPSILYHFYGGQDMFAYFQTPWMYSIFKDRIVGELLSPFLGLLFLFSLYKIFTSGKNHEETHFLLLWALSALTCIIILPWVNLNHSYYQLILLPPAALCIGIFLYSLFEKLYPVTLRVLAGITVFIFLGYSLYYIPSVIFINSLFTPEVRYDFFQKDITRTQQFIPLNDRIIVVSDIDESSPTLLNHVDRKGWVIPVNSINQGYLVPQVARLKKLGAKCFIIPKTPYYTATENYDVTDLINYAKRNYSSLYEGTTIIIFRL